jgi:hypothetical protein
MDTIEKWIKEQLNEGYSPEQIKLSLQKSGYNPSIVDKILNLTYMAHDSGIGLHFYMHPVSFYKNCVDYGRP